MKKRDIVFWLVFILIEVLYARATFATTINLAYGECQNFTLDTNESIEVCAPEWIDLNITECPACPPPSHVDLNLLWSQNASANNVTATCQSWHDTNITICLPPPSPPPIVNMSLTYGQSATMNNFTASCAEWIDLNLTECQSCSVPEISYNLTYSETKKFNNFTASCAAWVDLNITEPQIVYEGCPQINRTLDLYPDGIYSNFTYGLVVRCLHSTVQPTTIYIQQALVPQTEYLNCNATEARVLSDRNVTLSIQQCIACPVCPTCNVSELCPPRPDDQILNCSVKACFCQSELADFVSMDAFSVGGARVAFNNSKNAFIARASAAENKSIEDNKLRLEAEDRYNILKGSNDDNNKLLIVVCIILVVSILVNYLKFRDVKSAISPPKNVERGD